MLKNLKLIRSIILIVGFLCAKSVLAQNEGPIIKNGVLVSWANASGDVTIPDEVVEIAPGVFHKNSKIKSLNLNNVRIVGNNALSNMSGLSSFSAPKVEVLGDSALYASGSWRAWRFFEADFPELRKIGKYGLSWALEPRMYMLPKVEVIGSKAFRSDPPQVIDLSEAINLKTIAPDAFPDRSPGRDNICNIFVANDEVLGRMPTNLPERVYAKVVNIDRKHPTLTMSLKEKKGNRYDRFPLTRESKGGVVGIDLGDGIIRLFSFDNWNGMESSVKFDWVRSPVENPTVKVYGNDFDGWSPGWLTFTALDLSKATHLKSMSIEDLPVSLLPDFKIFKKLEKLDFSSVNNIEKVDFSQNPLKELFVYGCDSLQTIIFPENSLEKLTIMTCKKITSIDVSRLTNLKDLSVSYSGLSGTLALNGLQKLEKADLSINKLEELIIDNPLLKELKCGKNRLKRITTIGTNGNSFRNARTVSVGGNVMKSAALNRLYAALPDLSKETTPGKLILLKNISTSEDDNEAMDSDLGLVLERNWKLYDLEGREMSGMIVKGDTLVSWNNASGDVVVPSNIKVILSKAFDSNPNITSITGDNVVICAGVRECENLKSVKFPKLKDVSDRSSVDYHGNVWDENGLPIYSNYSEVDGYDITLNYTRDAFFGCPKLAPVINEEGTLFYYSKEQAVGKVTLDPTIKAINYYAFDECDKMTELDAVSVVSIGRNAFYHCTGLTKVNLPALLHTQGNPFWANCPKLNEVKTSTGIWLDRKATGEVTIPEGIEFVAVNTYRGIKSITALHFPSTLRRIGQYAFYETGITQLPSLDKVTEIHPGAFMGCSALTGSILIPQSVKLLGDKAFASCKSITSADVQAKIKSVPRQLFLGCDALSSISLGVSIIECDLLLDNKLPEGKIAKLILHAPYKVDYKISGWSSTNPGNNYTGDPRKQLDIYVPASLLGAYETNHQRDEYYYAEHTYYPIENTASQATITIEQHPGYHIVIKSGEKEIQSGSTLPIGTPLTAWVEVDSGKVIDGLFLNGANIGSMNQFEFHLTEPITISAQVSDFNPDEWSLVASFSTVDTHKGDQLSFAFVNGNSQTFALTLDCGGGRYIQQVGHGASSLFGVKAAEDNPVVRLYEKKKVAVYAPINHITVIQDISNIEWGNAEHLKSLDIQTHLILYYDKYIKKTSPKQSLVTFDASKLTNLEWLWIESTKLTDLDLTYCTKLQHISLFDIPITSESHLKLPEQSPSIDLTFRLPLMSINVGKWKNLHKLYIYESPIEKLDLSNNPKLEEVGIRNCQNVSMIKASPVLSEFGFEFTFKGLTSMGACAWNDFYQSLPSGLNAEQKSLEFSKGMVAEISHTATSIATGKGYTVKQDYPSQDIQGVDDGCKNTYSFSATSNSSQAQIIYKEDGVEKPIPTEIPKNANIEVEYIYYNTSTSTYKINGFNSYDYPCEVLTSVDANAKRHDRILFKAIRDISIEQNLSNSTAKVELSTIGEGTLRLVGTTETVHEVGSTLSVEAIPATGWTLASIYANEENITSSKTFVLKEDTKIVATFTRETFAVTVDPSENGSVEAQNGLDLANVPYGTEVVLTATPNEGYELATLTANGVDIMSTMKFVVTDNTTIKASFTKKHFAVTIESAENGSVEAQNGLDLANVPYGTEVVLTATPNQGYELATLTANGVDIMSTMKFVVTDNTTIKATFTKVTAVGEIYDGAVRIYPNPTKNFVTIDLIKEQIGMKAILLNASGKIIRTIKLMSTPVRIDLSALVPGIYYINIGSKTYTVIKK